MIIHRAPLLSLALLAGCGGSFDGVDAGGIIRTESEPVDLGFEDGSEQQTLPLGATVSIRLVLPKSRFERIVDLETNAIDLDRFMITASRNIGDPEEGGFAAGESMTEFWIESGLLTRSSDELSHKLALNLNTLEPLVFPLGATILRFTYIEDSEVEESGTLSIELLANDRPSLSILFEQPPPDDTPLGIDLPRDEFGVQVTGTGLPFALILKGFPTGDSRAGFELPDLAISISCDRDLGNPALGGIPAGEDFGVLFGINIVPVIDPKTGIVTTGLRFQEGDSILPKAGLYTFTGSIADSFGVPSFEISNELRVIESITLEPDIMNIFRPSCATTGCHDAETRTQGLDLSSQVSVLETAIEVFARQPAEGSCAPLRIARYAPLESYLFHKIAGTHNDGCVLGRGSRMPQIGDPLMNDEIERIGRWILLGAPD